MRNRERGWLIFAHGFSRASVLDVVAVTLLSFLSGVIGFHKRLPIEMESRSRAASGR
jgi:hypothetical protein